VLVDNVLEPAILPALRAVQLEWRRKLFLPYKPVDMLTGIFDPLVGQIRITENTHHYVPCHGDEHFVASGHPK